MHLLMQEPWEAEEKRVALLAALLLPLAACTARTAKGKDAPLTAHVILESIKWKRKDAEGVAALHAAAPGLLQVHQSLQAHSLCRSLTNRVLVTYCVRP
jgi:hypothetical protein